MISSKNVEKSTNLDGMIPKDILSVSSFPNLNIRGGETQNDLLKDENKLLDNEALPQENGDIFDSVDENSNDPDLDEKTRDNQNIVDSNSEYYNIDSQGKSLYEEIAPYFTDSNERAVETTRGKMYLDEMFNPPLN